MLAPIARFVRGLVFHRGHSLYERSAVAMSPRRHSIRRLEFTSMAHAQELLDALPELESVTMPLGARTSRGPDHVRSLVVTGGTAVTDLVLGAWPALDTLTIACDRDISAGLATLGEKPYMQTLRVLRIRAPLETPVLRVLRDSLPKLTIEEL